MEKGIWRGGIYQPPEDLRREFMRLRMRETYPDEADEIALLWRGSEAEKAEHEAVYEAVRAEADLRYPKEVE